MRDLQYLTTLYASTASYGDSVTFAVQGFDPGLAVSYRLPRSAYAGFRINNVSEVRAFSEYPDFPYCHSKYFSAVTS
jgi:hypothetical protein